MSTTQTSTPTPSLSTVLKLGRVSNLPTVWTNALAAACLATAGAPDLWVALAASLALSAFYVGGMWLNDAFDAEIDARERANRPIPMGEIELSTVWTVGFALLGVGTLAAFAISPATGLAAIALGVAILLYDWLHKRTAFSPALMGAARFCAYAVGAAAAIAFAGEAAWSPALWGAAGLFAYVVGLTYAAKQEAYDRIDRAWPLAVFAAPLLFTLWLAVQTPIALPFWLALTALAAAALRLLFRRAKGDVPKAVVSLIAGIALYDAVLIASTGAWGLALLAVAGFGLTLALQRYAPGT